jgi:hypothetical protein
MNRLDLVHPTVVLGHEEGLRSGEHLLLLATKQKGRTLSGPPFGRGVRLAGYEQPEVVPQLTHLWQLPLGIMIDPHSGQVGASVRAMKL